MFFFLLDNSNVRDSLVMKKPLPEKSLKKINTKYSGTCLIRHTKGPGKCVRLYMMSDYSGFILVNRNTLEP